MSIWKNGKLVAGGSQALPLLTFVYADHILDDISWLRADTFSWQNGSVYQAVYQHLANDIDGKTLQSETIGGTTIQFYLADDGHKICPASEESNVVAIYNATGVAWYYIIDTTNERFKLPRTRFGFTGLRDNVGNYVEAGLPNITGEFWNRYNNVDIMFGPQSQGSGALKLKVTGRYQVCTNSSSYLDNSGSLEFDASGSSLIYGNSTTVQPKATQMYLYFYVGQFTQTALENTAGVVTEDFNELNAHKVVEFQAPTAQNNYTWYRKYADGWVEQGGITTNDEYTPVILPIPMQDTNYILLGQCEGLVVGNYNFVVMAKTATSFTADASYGGGVKRASWQVSGMAA